jgi:hypothetical protein
MVWGNENENGNGSGSGNAKVIALVGLRENPEEDTVAPEVEGVG